MQDASLANRTERPTDWTGVNWRAANRRVRNLRQRIFRATQDGDWDKAQSLQRLMLRSYANTLLSVRRVTQVNQGKRTAGVDKLVVKTPERRGQLVDHLMMGGVWGVALSTDGRLVASGGVDGTVRLWEAGSRACLRVLRAERRYERLETPLGAVLAAPR